MELPRRRTRTVRENVVPLINVVFLLLIFFLLAGTLDVPDLWEVDPPAAAEALPASRERARLLLTADGRIAFREHPVEGGERLAAAVAAYLQEGGDPIVQVKADGRATAGDLLPVLETLRGAGVEELDLLAEVVP